MSTSTAMQGGRRPRRPKAEWFTWDRQSHQKFLWAVELCGGIGTASPQPVFQTMQSHPDGPTPHLDKSHVKSHLQRERRLIRTRIGNLQSQEGDGVHLPFSGQGTDADGPFNLPLRQRGASAIGPSHTAGSLDLYQHGINPASFMTNNEHHVVSELPRSYDQPNTSLHEPERVVDVAGTDLQPSIGQHANDELCGNIPGSTLLLAKKPCRTEAEIHGKPALETTQQTSNASNELLQALLAVKAYEVHEQLKHARERMLVLMQELKAASTSVAGLTRQWHVMHDQLLGFCNSFD